MPPPPGPDKVKFTISARASSERRVNGQRR